MPSFLLPVVFLLGAGQPPTEAPAQTAAPAARTTTAEPTAEPKMICKYEHVTGSRLSKQKVCRPEGDDGQQSSTLQRQLDRFGDRGPPVPGFGN